MMIEKLFFWDVFEFVCLIFWEICIILDKIVSFRGGGLI